MSWEDFRILTRGEFFPSNEMQMLETQLWNYAKVGASHAVYTNRFHKLAWLVPHLVTTENKRIERSIKKNPEKRGNGGEPSKDRNGRQDNKRTRTGNAFATTANPVRREYTGHFPKDCRVVPRNVNSINAINPIARTCYECGSTDHFKAACPRLNQAQRPRGNHQNQVVAFNGGQGRRNNGNQSQGRAFMLGAEEARQDPNIVTGIEPSDLGFSYEIEIASGQLVEIDKVIRSRKLEIEGYARQEFHKGTIYLFNDPEQNFRPSRKLLNTLSLDESRSPAFNLFYDLEEYSEEEVAKTMAETMEQYMSKTRADYGSGIARPKIDDKDSFELKGQFLKELRDNTFSGLDHEDANEHIDKAL
ncbi:reverse transcriptase domain-containing protein [Tanacetum coccineum]